MLSVFTRFPPEKILIKLLTETHPSPPDQRAGGAAAGQGLRERGRERQEDEDGDRARVSVTPLTNCNITGLSKIEKP